MAKGLNGRQFPISVYTTITQQDKAVFALDIGVKIIEYYIDLFRIDYPLPKLGELLTSNIKFESRNFFSH